MSPLRYLLRRVVESGEWQVESGKGYLICVKVKAVQKVIWNTSFGLVQDPYDVLICVKDIPPRENHGIPCTNISGVSLNPLWVGETTFH
jgi:hypothetical protein